MVIINSITYPITDYIPLHSPWDHKSFNGIMHKLSVQDTYEAFQKNPELLSEAQFLDKMPECYKYTVKPTAKRLAAWPLFSVREKDYEVIGTENILHFFKMLTLFWHFLPKDDDGNKYCEIVPGSLWDEAFYHGPEGFDEWLDSIKTSYRDCGFLIRPDEGIAEFYYISIKEGKEMSLSYIIAGKQILTMNMNCNGYISSDINFGKNDMNGLMAIANARGCTFNNAFFQEDIYNILKYNYYKEYHGVKARKVARGETIRQGKGFSDIRVFSNTPCIIYNNEKS